MIARLFLGVVGCVGFVGIGLSALGCAQDRPALTIHAAARRQTFNQQFTAAYASRDPEGNTDLVLVDNAARQWLEGNHPDGPVRQVMHVRVLWLPTRDLKADHPSASNATIHWYVIGNEPARGADILEYAGTGFVVAEPGGPGTDLTIRTASLRPVACRGGLCDPIGPATLDGTVHALHDRQKVRQALSDVRAVIAAANGMPENLSSAHAKPESPSSLAR